MSSMVRTTMGMTMIASAIAPAQSEKQPVFSTISVQTNSPSSVDGAESRTSKTNRLALARTVPRAYPAR